MHNRKLKVLVGVHFENNKLNGEKTFNVNFFGGSSEKNGEKVLKTVIRELLEELFNINPLDIYLKNIVNYLNSPLILSKYHIFRNNTKSYSYVFNINILNDFVKILCGLSKKIIIKLPITSIKFKLINLCDYYFTSEGNKFNLIRFIKDREIESNKKISFNSLNEIKYISYVKLSELLLEDNSININVNINIVNFKSGTKTKINLSKFLKKFIKKPLLKDINKLEDYYNAKISKTS
jgi:hypothetical protein